jgi:CubicO group peptidase (beta-lactamase class C family)
MDQADLAGADLALSAKLEVTPMTAADSLPRALTPESVGLPAQSILRFLDRLEAARVCMHGFLLLRRGQIAAEGYWSPWTAERKHRMYSVSKSFVSLAVGLMIDEGKLSLTDRVADYFPDKTPQPLHPYLAEATVRDLLMMATPHSCNAYTQMDPDWVRAFFEKEPSHPPGTIFAYDTAATVVLGSIVERLSGQTFLAYMRPRLLDPIGFSADAWCVRTPEGTSWGGSGVICTLQDLAKVAAVCLNGGRWNGRQLLPQDYVAAATAKQIDNTIGGNCGYGYQIWREPENGFSFRGMGSQLAYCYPDQDFVFTCIADTQGAGPTGTVILDAMRQELLSSLSEQPLPEDPAAYNLLQERLAALRILPQAGDLVSPTADTVSGIWYEWADNPMGISRSRLTFLPDSLIWDYTNRQGDNRLHIGLGDCLAGPFPQLNYFGEQIGTASGTRYACLASAAWVEPHKIDFLIYITDDYFGTLKVSMAFKGDELAVYMTKVAEWFLDEYQGFAGGRAVREP